MEQEINSGFKAMGCMGTVVAAVLVGLFALVAWPSIEASQATQARADADAAWARMASIEAQTARDREANLHREQMFAMLTLALASHDGVLVAVAGVLGAVAGIAAVRWLDWQEIF